MNFVIQKFGGTSLSSREKRDIAIDKITAEIEEGNNPVVVVSAMGREGEAYATDTLLDLIDNGEVDISDRQKDLLVSCGEIISSVVLASELAGAGYEARSLTGWQAGIKTDSRFGGSRVREVNPARILQLWQKEIVPVVAGFQGITPRGDITTLGRGGSDTTASVLGYALEAEKVEIFTDVDGFMTSDPDKCQQAKKLDSITYNEACELAYQGAKVIHPRAAEVAMEADIPVFISPLDSGAEDEGTRINDKSVDVDSDRPATGIATRSDIVFVEVFPDDGKNYATGLKVFPLLAESDVSVDFINIRPGKISFVIDSDLEKKACDLIEEESLECKISTDFSKVSVVGGGMTGQPGVMARIVKALSEADVEIYQTTDSHTTISCLIESEQEKRAVKALHEAFKLSD